MKQKTMTKDEKKKLTLLIHEHKINNKERQNATKRYYDSRRRLLNKIVELNLPTKAPATYFKIVNEWL